MEIIVKNDYEEMSLYAAQVVIDVIKENPKAVICFPTGSTPLRMYELLVEACLNKEVDFSEVRVRSVDEYAGLAKDNDQSYAYFLWDNLLSKVNVNPENIRLIDGSTNDAEEACQKYQAMITDEGGIDLYIDGVGSNGHIGFNEPADSIALYYHNQEISLDTRLANSRFFGGLEEVPTHALSIGIYDILNAKKALFLSNGKHKAETWKRFLANDAVTTDFPLSFMRLAKNAIAVLDKDSAELIK